MPKESLSPNEVRDMCLAVADKIIESEPILTDADRQLGDGDHGIGMQRGMTAVKEKLGEADYESVGKVFMDMGMAMMSSMGGASGAVFGTLFRAGGKAIKGSETFGASEVGEFFKNAAQGVKDRGGAKPGDKTMVDALDPAAAAAESASGKSLCEALNDVSAAAANGREESKDMIATMGRARTLGEKSLGHPDAGAVSVAIIAQQMADFCGD